MLEFTYKGANAVVISTKKSTVVVDPKLSIVGLKDISVKDNVQITTDERFIVDDKDAKLTIDGPGEYEVGDFTVTGIAAQRHIDHQAGQLNDTIYRLEAGDISIGIIGNITPKLSEDQQEALGIIDVLIIPVGGSGYTLDAQSATAIVRQVEPKAVIPIHYADESIKYEVPQDSLDMFIADLAAPVEKVDTLKLKSVSSVPQSLTVFELSLRR